MALTEKQIQDFRKAFAEVLDDLVTNPKWGGYNIFPDTSIGEQVRAGGKLEFHPWVYESLVRLGQDFGFNCEEIESLKPTLFRNVPPRAAFRSTPV